MVTWNIIMVEDGVGSPNTTCDWDSRACLQRLLGVKTSTNILSPQNEDADIHLITNYFPERYSLEIAFAKKVRAKGKKVIVAFGADFKWNCGRDLLDVSAGGLNYTALAAEADLILSEVNPSWKIYGRYQSRVVPLSNPLEHFELTANKIRDIDILLVGAFGQGGIVYSLELAYMLKKVNSSLSVAIGLAPHLIKPFSNTYRDLRFEVTYPHGIYESYLKRTKVIINPELKARGGRAVAWGYYAGIPVVCAEGAFYSQLYPDIRFDKIDLEDIVNKAIYALANTNSIMSKATNLAKPFYFPEWKKTIYDRLGIKE